MRLSTTHSWGKAFLHYWRGCKLSGVEDTVFTVNNDHEEGSSPVFRICTKNCEVLGGAFG
jgi:hypothetical protein